MTILKLFWPCSIFLVKNHPNLSQFFFESQILALFDISPLKFIYSEKATKFCEISTVDLTVRLRKILWSSQNIWTLHQFSKFNNFLWVCWSLGKNISNFVPPTASEFSSLKTRQPVLPYLTLYLLRSKKRPTNFRGLISAKTWQSWRCYKSWRHFVHLQKVNY